jgi:Clathrin light chain
MDDDNNFFAMPPSNQPPVETDYGDFDQAGFASPPAVSGENYAPMDDYTPMDDYSPMDDMAPPQDAPIILGPPQESSEAPAEPSFLGDVTEAPEPTGPSPMQKWNEEWQQQLVERKDAENARKAELTEKARVDLEKFQQEREARRESRMTKNREDEQAKLEAIEADLENDNSWQRVCKMIDLSHDSTAKAQDNKRMRDVLILLKNDQARAQTLST